MDPLQLRRFPLSIVCCGRPAGRMRFCGLSQNHIFLLVLVVLVATVIYCTDITETTSDWTWFSRYSSNAQTPTEPPEPSPEMSQNKSLSPTGEDINVNSSTENTPEPQTPPPYKSPGPYWVEYPYEYHYTINEPDICKEHKPFVVLMVPVAPNNTAHRDIIRSTWGSESPVLDKVVLLFFLLGKQSGEGAEELQEQLLQESKEHGDLIQSNFVDCYKNLTIKTMVMMEWLDTYCSNTTYAVKIDSDGFMNVPNLINMLLKAPEANFFTGHWAKMLGVLRNPKSKWYVPQSAWPDEVYPPYVYGLVYVFSMDLPKKLVEASKHVKAFCFEDVYIGMCMQHLNMTFTAPADPWFFNSYPAQYSRCVYSRIVAVKPIDGLNRQWVWSDLKRPGPYC